MTAFFYSHLTEITASLTALLNLWLVVKGRQLNWLFGMLAVSLYFVIFLKVRLYAEMTLQLVFLGLQFYGLYQWRSGMTHQHGLIVRTLPKEGWPRIILLIAVLYGMSGLFLQSFTDSTFVWVDALITAMSLVAQWMMTKRYLQHWWIWILVDGMSVGLYWRKSLYFSCGLYAIFLIFCISGYLAWKKSIKNSNNCTRQANSQR